MLKFIMMISVLGATLFQNVAEAQRRGDGPTRADRDRRIHRPYSPPYTPPVVYVPQHRPQASLSLINLAASGMIAGCEVRRVNHWSNQLFVRGNYAGSFEVNRQDYQLAAAIDDNIYNGNCRQVSSSLMQRLNSPYLIDDFVRGRSANCYVLLNVSGWANQIYINGNFSGNYRSGSEDYQLRDALRNYVLSGVCAY